MQKVKCPNCEDGCIRVGVEASFPLLYDPDAPEGLEFKPDFTEGQYGMDIYPMCIEQWVCSSCNRETSYSELIEFIQQGKNVSKKDPSEEL